MRAFEGLFASVSKFMGLQMPLGNELLIANATHKWSFPCMCPHVSLQVTSLRKLLKAFFKRANQDLLFFLGPFDLFYLTYMDVISILFPKFNETML
jgi:hypothetical protein